MLLARANDEAIVITIENLEDWMEFFDNGVVDEITFDLEAEILDVFFPNWNTYIDPKDPFWSLKLEDINAIKIIIILFARDVLELEDINGESFYDVISCDCNLGNTVIEDGGDVPTYRDFLDFAGTVTFKIAPKPRKA